MIHIVGLLKLHRLYEQRREREEQGVLEVNISIRMEGNANTEITKRMKEHSIPKMVNPVAADTMINNARRYIYITQTVRRRLAMHAFCKDVTALP
ncbi:hypothetical protein YC2023_000118 [Brassica napus]